MSKYTFNEFTEQTIDFTDPKVVADYDKNQGPNIDDERELVEKLGVSSNHTVIEYGPGTGALPCCWTRGVGSPATRHRTSRISITS